MLAPSLIADGKDSTALSALPRSVPFTTFQKLESASSNEDFLELAADYATHSGAARDLIKLAKLGLEGENGSVELVTVYATRAADEIKEANQILQVLVQESWYSTVAQNPMCRALPLNC